jgi:tripartite-type tricarboxylate transporter receptor subunit TctC
MIFRSFRVFLACLAFSFAAGVAAQPYPKKPIVMISPWPPAGPAELVARVVGGKLSELLGQPVVIESKPGANGTIGATFVAKAVPDGYTLLFSHVGPIAISPALQKDMPYDSAKDFAPITQVVSGPTILVVRPGIPVKNMKELLAYAKANPGKLSYGSVGPGSTTHLAGEMVKLMGGVDILHVPYKGAAPVVTDMLGGQIDMGFINVAGILPQIRSGKVRPIAVSTLKRSSILPDLPTVAETLPGFEVNSWYGMMAPAGTPKDIVALLYRETAKVLKMPDVIERMKESGLDTVGSTPEEYAAKIQDDLERWAKIIKAANVKLD